MNLTYVKEQIRTPEADLCLCVVTVSEDICSGICCGSHESRVELPLQMSTAVALFVLECARNLESWRIAGISQRKTFRHIHHVHPIYYTIWSVNLWIVRGFILLNIISDERLTANQNKAEDVILSAACLELNGSYFQWVAMTDQCKRLSLKLLQQ